MEAFTRIEGVAASLPRPNIDTDAVIPIKYQRSLSADLGEGLFGGWRYDIYGKEIEDFVLNRAPFRESKILIGGINFGCGSSREAAVWAIMQFGVRSVIAPSFSDIFTENAYKNGLLPVILDLEEVERLHRHCQTSENPLVCVDLEHCIVEIPNSYSFSFSISKSRRVALMEGLDEIGLTLKHSDDIDCFQADNAKMFPWIFDRGL